MANVSFIDSKPSNMSESMSFHPLTTVIGLTVIGVISFFENTTVCALFVANKKLRNTTNVFVISLAISDMFVSLLFIPVYLITPIGHAYSLYIVTFLLFTSLFNMCGVTYDRYHAILYPLTYHAVFTSWRTAWILFFIWFSPLLLVFLPASWSAQSPKTISTIDRYYIIFMVLILFLASCIIAKVYFGIFKAIKRQMRMTRNVNLPELSSSVCLERYTCDTNMSSFQVECPDLTEQQTKTMKPNESQQFDFEASTNTSNLQLPMTRPRLRNSNNNSRFKRYSGKLLNDVRAAKLFAIIILVFIISWFPVIFINVMSAIDKLEFVPHFIFEVSVFAFVGNAAVNPFLFTFYKHDYKQALYKIVHWRFKCTKKQPANRCDPLLS